MYYYMYIYYSNKHCRGANVQALQINIGRVLHHNIITRNLKLRYTRVYFVGIDTISHGGGVGQP
jgi:hypothetical protein